MPKTPKTTDETPKAKQPTAGEQRFALYEQHAPNQPPREAIAALDYPNPQEPCYDCGSTIAHRHTPLCAMADAGDRMDLPAKPGTQYWTGEMPEQQRADVARWAAAEAESDPEQGHADAAEIAMLERAAGALPENAGADRAAEAIAERIAEIKGDYPDELNDEQD